MNDGLSQYAIDELIHIEQMIAAEKVCHDRLSELDEMLRTTKIPALQSDPVQGGGSKTEDRWLNHIAQKADEERRLKTIRRRIRRFNTAWAVLAERDRDVLTVFYIQGGKGCAERMATRGHCDERTTFRWRDEAVLNFTRGFYGLIAD